MLTEVDETKYDYNSSGKLTSITDRNNNNRSLTFDGSSRLTAVIEPGGVGS